MKKFKTIDEAEKHYSKKINELVKDKNDMTLFRKEKNNEEACVRIFQKNSLVCKNCTNYCIQVDKERKKLIKKYQRAISKIPIKEQNNEKSLLH